ncbi:MAG: DUF1304 domain-containing protein [Nostoc sp.]|uniref:DUF1304 domain-containing protein n=1 Tax=Nostoc sp. TaxID=1180 RepID=UPI002FFD31F4
MSRQLLLKTGDAARSKIPVGVQVGEPQGRTGFSVPLWLNKLLLNQGLYNGFLAAGLIWELFISQFPQFEPSCIVIFFLICVAIAGIFGSISLKRPTAFLIQSVPAILALFLLWFPNRELSSVLPQRLGS